MMKQYQPVRVSDHLCFTKYGKHQFNDLLPIPFTTESFHHTSSRIKQIQDYLGIKILIENVSSYLQFEASEMNEADFSFMGDSYKLVLEAKDKLADTIALAKASENKDFITYHSRRLVEMSIAIIQSFLLMKDAQHSDRKKKIAELFIEKTSSMVEHHKHFITDGRAVLLDHYKDIIG